jgi:hypothetical protein
MKIIPLLVVVAVLAGAGYYVWNTQPELLAKLHLGQDAGGKASGDTATTSPGELPATQTLVKCTDGNGNSSYTNGPCPAGQQQSDVKLKPLQTVHLPTGAAPATAGGGGGGSNAATPTREPTRQNAQGALHQKFLPQ